MTVSAETLVSHLEILRSERVGELTPEQVRFVETAERQGLRLLRLIQDLRTVALVETGALELVANGSDPDSLGLALANAVTTLHGGAVSRREDDGEVSLVLSLGVELAAEAPGRPAAAAA